MYSASVYCIMYKLYNEQCMHMHIPNNSNHLQETKENEVIQDKPNVDHLFTDLHNIIPNNGGVCRDLDHSFSRLYCCMSINDLYNFRILSSE